MIRQEPTHRRKREPECPYCNHELEYAWELCFGDEDSAIVECDECEREYKICCHFEVTYNSYEIEDDT